MTRKAKISTIFSTETNTKTKKMVPKTRVTTRESSVRTIAASSWDKLLSNT